MEANPDYPWDYRSLSSNPKITWDIVEANPDKPWDHYLGVSKNPNITLEILKANPDKPWYYYGICFNPNITWDFIESKSKQVCWSYSEVCWSYSALSANPMKKHPFFQNKQLSYVLK